MDTVHAVAVQVAELKFHAQTVGMAAAELVHIAITSPPA